MKGVTLDLADDGGDFWEVAELDSGTNTIWEVDTGDVSFALSPLMVASGTVNATLTALLGDFYFNSATLEVEATNSGSGAIPNPKPATILLMSAGMLGLAVYGRKRFQDKKAELDIKITQGYTGYHDLLPGFRY